MNSRRRRLAAALTSIISDLLTLLFPLLHSDDSDTNPLSTPFDSDSFHKNLSLLQHFLAPSEIASALTIVSRKRKRDPVFGQPDVDADLGVGDGFDESGRVNPRSSLVRNPNSFQLCFKMSSSTFKWLSGLLEPLLDCRDPVNNPLNLSPDLRLGIGLTRLATGSDYAEIGKRFGVSQFAARFCTKQLCRVLCTNYRFWVGFPSQNHEMENVVSGFEDISGLPKCCGVIVCQRFDVERSSKTVAAQIVVDSSSRILSIAVGFHGDKDDYNVLKGSTLLQDVEDGSFLGSKPLILDGVEIRQYLVSGHGGYPLLPWLMIPYDHPLIGSNEERFNNAVQLMSVSALKTVASLRSWGVLKQTVNADFKTAVKYIGACSILHNVLLMREEDLTLPDCFKDDLVDCQGPSFCRAVELEDTAGSRIRNALAKAAI